MTNLEITNGIARLTISAPPLNILTRAELKSLREALAEAQANETVRVLLLSAEGRHFSAGASIEEHLPPECDAMIEEFTDTVLALYACPLPVIAAVQGRCLGGGFELVQGADLVVAAQNAQFGQPEILLGVFAPIACALLPELIGNAHAAQMLFTGDPMSAEAAHTAGFVSSVVPPELLADTASTLAERIARHSAATLRLMKQALRANHPDVANRIARAAQTYRSDLMRTRDALEGLQAFLEKRSPQWSHA